jgi:rhodanese-related sulfurtransferase
MDAYRSPDELQRAEQSGSAPTVVDVRSPDEYRAGHLPGALNIPADQLQDRLGDIPADRPVVTY